MNVTSGQLSIPMKFQTFFSHLSQISRFMLSLIFITPAFPKSAPWFDLYAMLFFALAAGLNVTMPVEP